MNTNQLPKDLAKLLNNTTHQLIHMGESRDTVTKYEKNSETYFLKTGKISHVSKREHEMLAWLNGKLPVPQVIYHIETEDMYYLLTTSAKGIMSCTERGLAYDEESITHALADGLLQFQSIDISTCPLENKLEQRLKTARYNIENNLVDLNRMAYTFSENKRFQTPIALYEYLVKNKPDEELHLTHGDFCLPNIFVAGKKATGFIDMGHGGVCDKYQDIALCLRSLRYNSFNNDDDKALLFECLGITPDWDKIDYYTLLDVLF